MQARGSGRRSMRSAAFNFPQESLPFTIIQSSSAITELNLFYHSILARHSRSVTVVFCIWVAAVVVVLFLVEIMAQVPQNAGTGDYVKAPETYQREMPVGEQLVQLKDAAKGKINEFADQANIRYDQPQNDPANPASDERLARDMDTTAQHAAGSVETAKGQVGRAVDAVSQTAQSMKGAFVATKNEGTATPTSPNLPQKPAPAQSVSESLGQTAATVTDAVKNLFAPRNTVPGTQPGLNNLTTDMPEDVPRRAPQ